MPVIKTPAIPPRLSLADVQTSLAGVPPFDVTIAAEYAEEVTGEQAGEILAGIPADGVLRLSAAAVTFSS